MLPFDSHSEKRITYILATRNRAGFLAKALDEIPKLKTKDDELIVVDGLSTDSTAEVVRNAGKLVDVFVSEADLSEGHAFNKGLLLARGKYIKLLSDDDVVFPSAMEEAVGVLEANPDVELLMCGGTKLIGEQKHTVYVREGVNYGKSIKDVFRYTGCGLGIVMRRSALAKIGLLNPDAVALDVDFLCQAISRKALVRFCRIDMYIHPILEHSGSVRRQEQWKADVARLKRKHRVVLWLDYVPTFVLPIGRVIKKLFKVVSPHSNKPKWDKGFS